MTPIQIIPIEDALILRGHTSELLILPDHVVALRGLSDKKAFAKYFLEKAMVNRSARKLLESWIKKDLGLWQRIYNGIHKDTDAPSEG